LLVDVRTEAEFAEAHVNGSTNIPLDQLPNQLEKFKGKSKLLFFAEAKSQWSCQNDFEQNGFKKRH
jgi:rhodanese-related sulfurtransferase